MITKHILGPIWHPMLWVIRKLHIPPEFCHHAFINTLVVDGWLRKQLDRGMYLLALAIMFGVLWPAVKLGLIKPADDVEDGEVIL